MKKTIICDIPMKKGLSKCVYASQDRSVPSSSEAVIFPINAFLRPFNISFNDISSASAASEQNKLEMQNFDESSVLARWEKFAEKDFKISVDKIATVGIIKYSLLKHEEGNIFLLGIGEGYQDRFDAFKNVASGLGNDLALDLYNSIDDVGCVKRHPRVKVLCLWPIM